MFHSWFEKPIVQLADKYNEQDGLHAQLSRWVQAYGKQLVQMHMNFTLEDVVNKHVWGGKCMNGPSSWNDKVWRE